MSDLDLARLLRDSQDLRQYQDEHWEGTFQDYLSLVQRTRSSCGRRASGSTTWS